MNLLNRKLVISVTLLITSGFISKMFITSSAKAQEQTNETLLRNGNFSQIVEETQLPDHWQTQSERGSRAKFTLETQGARSNPNALLITVESGTARVQQTLSGVPTAPTILSGYAKVPTADQKVQGILQVFGETGGEPLLTIAVPITSSTDWKKFSQRLLLPQIAKRAVLSFEAHGKGDVWLDDIAIEPLTQTGGNTPNDPGPNNS